MSYTPCLGEGVYDGDIDGVHVIWGPSALKRLPQDAETLKVAVATLKALTEHFLYASAKRIGCAQVNILGAPHEFTTNSATDDVQSDLNHISAQFSDCVPGGLAQSGRYKVHVYLDGVETGATAYDNVRVAGERVNKQNKKGRDTLSVELSTGTYPTS